MKKNLYYILFLLISLSCKNSNIEAVESETTDTSSFINENLETDESLLISDSTGLNNEFNESNGILSCNGNKFETDGKNASFSSIGFQEVRKYNFDFFGFNSEDGSIILVDNLGKKFVMLNLCMGREVMTYSVKDSIIGIYKFEPKRYFIETILVKNGEERNEVWEIEPELERTMMVDLTANDMQSLEIRHSQNPTDE